MTAKDREEIRKLLKEELPCRDHEERIDYTERILNNGLKEDVRTLKRWIWGLMAMLIVYGLIDKIF
ncbi:MAG: hypothetical protein AMS17_15780 [Spirochaetes bacterium DG_61]|nr:MAG: hypothetical protein AMS17_15780 [Spirochaetes bacterium DG_61]